jgi:lipopolysaccharide transport system ATP-binding protein
MNAIEVCDLGKIYRRYDARRPSTLQEALLSGFRHLRQGDAHWGLRHVSFQLHQGGALGVIGRNGAGKSTLLRLIGGVLRADEGSVKVQGRLGGLLDLTAGFHPDLTGRENSEVSGILRGLTRAEVRHRLGSIVDFAELQDAIDRPLRTYSTGMQMRLAFAVAIHCEPDVLLVDEVLAVGDAAFQAKCLDRIRHLRAQGCSILLVSHHMSLVEQMCDEALWLKEGSVVSTGPVRKLAAEYAASLRNETIDRTPIDALPTITSQGIVLRMRQNRFGSLEIEMTDVRVCTGSDPSGLEMNNGDPLSVEIDYVVNQSVEMPVVSVTVIHDDGSVCISATTEESALELPKGIRSGEITVRWRQVAVEPGTYFIEVGLYRRDWAYAYDYHARSYPLVVRDRTWRSTQPTPTLSERAHAEWVFNEKGGVREIVRNS